MLLRVETGRRYPPDSPEAGAGCESIWLDGREFVMSAPIKPGRGLSRRRFAALLTASACLPVLQGAEAQTRTVPGANGPVALPVSPKRIVVLDAGLASYAYALEAPVVAVDVRFPDGRINRRTGFPPLWNARAVAQKSTVLPQRPDGLDLEAIKAAAPDLILAGGRNPGGRLSRAAQAELAAIAPVFVLPEELPSWREELAGVADALGRTDAVAGLIAAYETRAKETAGKIALPQGAVALLQANPAGIHEDPFAIAAASNLGRTLSGLGFEIDDAAAKVSGGKLDAEGRVVVPIGDVLGVFGARNLIIVSNGPVSMGQLCCDPGYRQLDAIISYRRWELDESALRPDCLGALRVLDMIESAFPKKA